MSSSSTLTSSMRSMTLSDDRRTENRHRRHQRNSCFEPSGRSTNAIPGPALPIAQKRDDILRSVAREKVVIIAGETGSGKSTQVPKIILQDAKETAGGLAKVIVTQPRRVAAVSLAKRVAQELGEADVGLSVGHHVRMRYVSPKDTLPATVTFVTLRMVFEYMKRDPSLTGVTHLILDEVHERDVFLEVLLNMAKDKISRGEWKFKLLLMSATMNSKELSKFFWNCPVIEANSRQHPIENFYLEDVYSVVDFKVANKPKKEIVTNAVPFKELSEPMTAFFRENVNRYRGPTITKVKNPKSEALDYNLIKQLLYYIDKEYPADRDEKKGHGVLIFLPGVTEVERMKECLMKRGGSRYHISTLYSLMSNKEQEAALRQGQRDNRRRVIIATNVAESSITVPGLRFVIDSGKVKTSGYLPDQDLDTLDLEWVSKANVRQRSGRVGRIGPGICFKLFSRARESTFQDFGVPEILRSRLEDAVFNLRCSGHTIDEMRKYLFATDRISTQSKAIDVALVNLKLYKLLNSDNSVTDLGLIVGRLGLEPKLGKLAVLGAMNKCLFPAIAIAAALSYNEIMLPAFQEVEVAQRENFRKTLAEGTRSDHLMFAQVLKGFRGGQLNCEEGEEHGWLNKGVLNGASEVMDDLARRLYTLKLIQTQRATDPKANEMRYNDDQVKKVLREALSPSSGKAAFQQFEGESTLVIRDDRNEALGKVVNVNQADGDLHGATLVFYKRLRNTKQKTLILDSTALVQNNNW